jgi:hypothetical protein
VRAAGGERHQAPFSWTPSRACSVQILWISDAAPALPADLQRLLQLHLLVHNLLVSARLAVHTLQDAHTCEFVVIDLCHLCLDDP